MNERMFFVYENLVCSFAVSEQTLRGFCVCIS